MNALQARLLLGALIEQEGVEKMDHIFFGFILYRSDSTLWDEILDNLAVDDELTRNQQIADQWVAKVREVAEKLKQST